MISRIFLLGCQPHFPVMMPGGRGSAIPSGTGMTGSSDLEIDVVVLSAGVRYKQQLQHTKTLSLWGQ